MNFGMITLNRNIKTMQNYVTQILTALLFILKLKIFIKTLLMMLRNWFDTFNYDESDERPFPIGKSKKVIALFKDELGKILCQNLLDSE